MFSRFSVKKPLTVLVGVVIAVVLGAVSFSRMTPDLLPNINMPYAVIVTAYPGATPEEVEQEVTKPIEQAMATLDHLDGLTSISRENASQVMLALTDSANMDTLTSEIREKLNAVSGAWGDGVGTPYIMKINPNMLPVAVCAVEMEGLDNKGLTNLLDGELLVKLEGVEGVASVSVSGNVTENVQVELRQEKIDEVNRRIREKLEGTFADAEAELTEKSSEVESGLAESEEQAALLDQQQAQLQAGQDQLAQQGGQAQGQLLSKKVEIETAKAQLQAQLTTLGESEKALLETQTQLQGLAATLSGLAGQVQALEEAIAGLEQAAAGYEVLAQQKAALEGQLAQAVPGSPEAEELRQQLTQVEGQIAQAEAILAGFGVTIDGAPAKIAELREAREAAAQALEEARAAIAATGVDPDSLDSSLAEVNENLAKVQAGKAAMQQTLSQLEAGGITVDQALAELSRQQTSGLLQISAGLSQIMAGKSAIASAQSQLTAAKEQIQSATEDFEEQKKAAFAGAKLDITMDMVSTILSAQHFSMPAGYIEEDGVQTLVRVGNKLEDLEELKALVLFDTGEDAIGPVTLADVAEVTLESNAGDVYAKVNGQDAVALSFTKQSAYSTAQVSKNIQERFEQLSEQYQGLHFTMLSDQGDYIYIVVDTVLQNLVLGAGLAVLILLLFLKDLRPTLAVACSIPISLLVAIVLMYFSGVTLNVISLSGLAVGVGMLVDNSVVVIENIFRLRAEGVPAAKASVQGAVQVTGAIIASTLTTICVFLPIVFVEGVTRELFTDMALTIGYSLLASLFVAITLVPAMTSATLRGGKIKGSRFFDSLLAGYGRVATVSLNHKWVALTLSVVLLAASVWLALGRGFLFMPSMSGTQLSVSLVPEDEALSFAEKTQLYDQAAQRILELEGIETVGALSSGSDGGGMLAMMGGSGGEISMYALLDQDAGVKDSELAKQIKEACSGLPCEVSAQGAMDMSSAMSSISGAGVEVKLYGEDMDALLEAADSLGEELSALEGIQSAETGLEEEAEPELRIVVDKNKAMAEGLTVAQVYQSVRAAVTGSATAASMDVGGVAEDVLVLHPKTGEMTASYLKGLVLTATDRKTGETRDVPLVRVASFEERQSLTSIRRENQKRVLTLTAQVAEGHNVSLAAQEVERTLKDYQLPEGITLEITGENEAIMEAMEQLVYMAALAILIIYLIMVIQFQSLLLPFIVMFTIPLAFTGGFAALYLCGMEVSVVSMIGFIMLSGIIVNNGIVLIDYINQLRALGIPRREAIVQAGRTRLRPILMTVLTTVLGLVFMAVGTGTGAEMMQPIAVVCIGGLLYATLMTLFVVPAMYELLSPREMRHVDLGE